LTTGGGFAAVLTIRRAQSKRTGSLASMMRTVHHVGNRAAIFITDLPNSAAPSRFAGRHSTGHENISRECV